MKQNIEKLGAATLDRIRGVGNAAELLFQTLFARPRWKTVGLFAEQMHWVGVMSLLIIMVSGLFIGLVLGLQGYRILSAYGSESSLGVMVAQVLIRELGPVITALLFAGRAGSALTAEIGLMKSSEQLASMEMIGVDPVRQIISPRFWAGVFSMPMLAIIFTAVGIIGGKMVGVDWLGVYEGSYWGNMQGSVNFVGDVLQGVVKSVVFGVACTWIAVYQGYSCLPTPEGVSTATTRTVVYSSLCVLGLDFVLTAVMFGG